MTATKENALTVLSSAVSAFDHLREAEKALRVALNHAEVDYEHNAEALRSIVGGLRLVTSAVAGQASTWSDYAHARND